MQFCAGKFFSKARIDMKEYVGEGVEAQLHSFLIHLVDIFNGKFYTAAPLLPVNFEYEAWVYQSRLNGCTKRDTSCRRQELNHVARSLALVPTELSLYSGVHRKNMVTVLNFSFRKTGFCSDKIH
jgi:hypothetical protein